MYSTDLQDVAKKLGYWDGKEPLKFWKIINGKKPFAIREYLYPEYTCTITKSFF